MAMTITVPINSARGTLRPGSRISSAMYDAAFHPEYVNMIGINAKSRPVIATGPADCVTFDGEPVPAVSPYAMHNTSDTIFSVVRTLLAMRPGPTPRM